MREGSRSRRSGASSRGVPFLNGRNSCGHESMVTTPTGPEYSPSRQAAAPTPASLYVCICMDVGREVGGVAARALDSRPLSLRFVRQSKVGLFSRILRRELFTFK